jgi:hypothetical protein
MAGTLALLLVFAACGGASAEDYFVPASEVAARYDAATDEVFGAYTDTLREAVESFRDATRGDEPDTALVLAETQKLLDVTIVELSAAFESARTVLATFITELNALDPPSEAQDAHTNLVAALIRSRDAIPDLVASFIGATSLREVDALITGSAFGDAQPAISAACQSLETIAADEGYPLELCGAEETP